MIFCLFLSATVSVVSNLHAHPLSPSLLQVTELDSGKIQVYWKRPNKKVPGEILRPLLPSICKQEGEIISKMIQAAHEESWQMSCNSSLVGQQIGVESNYLQSNVILRLNLSDGRNYQKVLNAQMPMFIIPQYPELKNLFRDYLDLGLKHILTGWDHLLFVLGLVLLVKNRKVLFWTITAFTLGHSVTLSLAALGFVQAGSSAIEAMIAFSIFVLAIELTRSQKGKGTFFHRYPWVMAFGFGLLHGLGFAGALIEIGLPVVEIPIALFSFNVGIELGQIVFIIFLIIFNLIWRRIHFPFWISKEAIPVYLIGIFSSFWFIERLSDVLGS